MADTDTELTPQEDRLIACAARGEWWKPETEGEEKPDFDPAKASAWNPNRTLRAAVIRCLACGETWPGKTTPWPVAPKGLQIEGARIAGDLDLEGVTIDCSLWLHSCFFDEQIILTNAQTRTVGFGGSHLKKGCNATSLHVRGDLYLRNWFVAQGEVSLIGATIDGQLDCHEGRFENAGGIAIHAAAITVGGDMFFSDGFVAKGEVILRRAFIDGQLDCTKGSFENAGGTALNAAVITVGADMFLRDGFAAKGVVILAGAKIDGQLVCIKGSFENAGGTALNAAAITVGASVFLRDGFAAKGEVILRRAKIEGQLSCTNGRFENAGGTALNADAITVGASVLLSDGFAAKGAVNLAGAKIKGQFDCSKGSFENAGGTALYADAIAIGGDVLLVDGFAANGEVNFYRAAIAGILLCQTAALDNPKGDALNLTLAEIGAGLFLTELTHGDGQPGVAGRVVLAQATCRTYCDDEGSWPDAGKLVLDGFTYQRFHDCATDWQTRLKWLQRQPDDHLKDRFHPQPWTQAAEVLREMGHDDDAKELGLRREIARARSAGLRWHEKRWLGFLRLTIGNGYKPHWALAWSALFFAIGWLTFATAANLGFMAPRDGSVLAYLAEDPPRHLPPQYPRFNAPLYALDAFLPVIELGQDAAWAPSNIQTGLRRATGDGWVVEAARLALGHDWTVRGMAKPGPVGNGFWDRRAADAVWAFGNGLHRFIYWVTDVLGWIFVSLYIAGMSGVVKRDK